MCYHLIVNVSMTYLQDIDSLMSLCFFSLTSCEYRLDISDMLEGTTTDDKELTTANNEVREGTDWEYGKISIPLSFYCISHPKKRNDGQTVNAKSLDFTL